MKKIMLMLFMIIMVAVLSGCGFTSKNNEAVGQVKKIKFVTPIVCPDYALVDISLGVMRNGVGSMSTQDIWLVVHNNGGNSIEMLKKAAETGEIVKFQYDVKRGAICTPKSYLNKVEITK